MVEITLFKISLGLLLILLALVVFLIFRLRSTNQRMQTIYEKLLGSQTKGQIGEAILRETLKPFLDTEIVAENLTINGTRQHVEFAIELEDKVYCPIDQKTSGKARIDIEDVANKYIGKPNTTFFAILTVPDDLYGRYMRERDYALDKGVFLVKNQDLPFLLPVLLRLYKKFKLSKDTRNLNKTVTLFKSSQAELHKIFANLDKQYDNFKKQFEHFVSLD